jgi:hypothetical protein
MMPMYRQSKGKKPSRYTAIQTLGCTKKEDLTMKRTNVLAGVLAAVLMFGSALAGWASDGDEDGGGIFTLTDIPAEYYGKYIALYAAYDDGAIIIGAHDIDGETGNLLLVVITGGSVDIPLWFVTDGGDRINIDKYAGNDQLDVEIMVFNDETIILLDDPQPLCWAEFDDVEFIKERATLSWNDAAASSL